MTTENQADHSHERPGMMPYGNTDTAIRREVEAIAERFPDTDIAVIDAAVREAFAELREKAEVETHVLALTRNRVYDRLGAQGHSFQPAAPPVNTDQSDVTVYPAATGGTADDEPTRQHWKSAMTPEEHHWRATRPPPSLRPPACTGR